MPELTRHLTWPDVTDDWTINYGEIGVGRVTRHQSTAEVIWRWIVGIYAGAHPRDNLAGILAHPSASYFSHSSLQYNSSFGDRNMSWPEYSVAPPESVFALGVVCINFTRFELGQTWMLAAVANISEKEAIVKAAKTHPSDRGKLIRQNMARFEWPTDVGTAINHYIQANDVLVSSRNKLIHSNMVEAWKDKTAFFSLSRQGIQTTFQSTLPEIRQVADDLYDYFWFGHALSNYIASEIHYAAREEGMMAFGQLPELLPLPVHIDPSQRPKME